MQRYGRLIGTVHRGARNMRDRGIGNLTQGVEEFGCDVYTDMDKALKGPMSST